MQRSKLLLAILGLLFLTGCQEDLPTYSTFCQDNTTPPQCLHYIVLNSQDKERLQRSFGLKDDDHCGYRVEITRYHVGDCNNPVVKSVGGDLNGYVRVEVKKGFKRYYKVQSDYKNDVGAAFERVLKRVKIDLNQ